MPPVVALGLCSVGVLVLLWRESRVRPGVSVASWIPTIWLLIIGSRSVGQWLNLSAPVGAADAYVDGSPVDRMVFFALMVSAIVILAYRRFALGRLIMQNKMWVLFFLYCGLSVAWSDFPAVTFRRWFKSAGDPLMVFVLLTEARPALAIEVVLRRCAYVLLPSPGYQNPRPQDGPVIQQAVTVELGPNANERRDLSLVGPQPYTPDTGPCCKPYGAPPARRRIV